jgi:hypothetical protein
MLLPNTSQRPFKGKAQVFVIFTPKMLYDLENMSTSPC